MFMEATEVSVGGHCHYMGSPLPACTQHGLLGCPCDPWAVTLPLEQQGSASLYSEKGGQAMSAWKRKRLDFVSFTD